MTTPNQSEELTRRVAQAIQGAMVSQARSHVADLETGASRLKETFATAQKESDRSCSVLLFAFAEELMQDCIERNFATEAKKSWDHAVGANGFLGTAASKISILELLRWIRPHVAADLRLMKSVRNKFAHDATVQSFDDNQIKGWITSMKRRESVLIDKVEFIRKENLLSMRQKFEIRSIMTLSTLAFDALVGPASREFRVDPNQLSEVGYDNQPENIQELLNIGSRLALEVLSAAGMIDESKAPK